MIKHYNIIRQY